MLWSPDRRPKNATKKIVIFFDRPPKKNRHFFDKTPQKNEKNEKPQKKSRDFWPQTAHGGPLVAKKNVSLIGVIQLV